MMYRGSMVPNMTRIGADHTSIILHSALLIYGALDTHGMILVGIYWCVTIKDISALACLLPSVTLSSSMPAYTTGLHQHTIPAHLPHHL